MTKWVTISEAAVILGMSERTVWRKISKGILESRMDKSKRLVKLDEDDKLTDDNVIELQTLSDKDALLRWIKNELDRKNEIIESLRIELKEKEKRIEHLEAEIRTIRERSDTIVMKLAEELSAQRMLLEGKLPKRKDTDSFLRRLLKKDEAES